MLKNRFPGIRHADMIKKRDSIKRDSIIRIRPGGHFMERMQPVAENKGTVFLYFPEFRHTPEYKGAGFRYSALAG
jgi:hypothetical protein